MKKLIGAAMMLLMGIVAVQAVAGKVVKIAYQSKNEGKKGSYGVSYDGEGRLSFLLTSDNVAFGNFQGDGYMITYPSTTEVTVRRLKGKDPVALYEYTSEGMQKWTLDFKVLSVGYGEGVIKKEGLSLETHLYDRKRAIITTGKNKFKERNIVESTLDISGAKAKMKVKYTAVPYNVFSYGFDYMSFIISEFLGVQFGCFDNWACSGMCFMENYPAEIELADRKYVFDYSTSMKHIEVKTVVKNRMQERYIFDITQ